MRSDNAPNAAPPSRPTRGPRPRPRLRSSSGSFHAGDIIPSLSQDSYRRSYRRASTNRYHTFDTPPPRAPSDHTDASLDHASDASGSSHDSGPGAARHANHKSRVTPLPKRQLALLAMLSLCEQTALNSISPYLPEMVRSFDEIPPAQVGLYVGLIASAFALAQLLTNFLWGSLSDSVGRKPVLLAGTSLLGVCFAFFGFCNQYWQLVLVHVAMGLLNGNAAVVPTCLGEVTDRSNQSFAFTWLPVMYSLGGITGPALGGLLVGPAGTAHRFLAPNVLASALLFAGVLVLAVWFEETLDNCDRAENRALVWLQKWCSCGRARRGRVGSWSSRWPSGGQAPAEPDTSDSDEAAEGDGLLGQEGEEDEQQDEKSIWRQILNRRTVIVLLTYLVFQLANISFNSLFPIFASAPTPTGRALSPERVGLLLSFSGCVTIVFQGFLFQSLKAKLGNLGTYQGALLGLALSMALMPWVTKLDDGPLFGWGSAKWWLFAEIAAVLAVKNISAVGGLSSVLLLITNSAPSHETLGALNGIAQTLSAAGRSFGPFLAGALFTLSSRIQPRGELMVWGVFGAVALLGWLASLAIRGGGLESGDWEGSDDESEAEDEDV